VAELEITPEQTEAERAAIRAALAEEGCEQDVSFEQELPEYE
jgi:hypothetical protein